jgi:hypothetical protein
MKVIAISIESTRVIFYLLEAASDGTVTNIASEVKSISLNDDQNNAEIRAFKEQIYAFFDRIAPDRIAILKRMTKGRFAASSSSFKLEAIMQCYVPCEVELVAPLTVKAFYKKNVFTQNPSTKYQLSAAQLAQYLIG